MKLTSYAIKNRHGLVLSSDDAGIQIVGGGNSAGQAALFLSDSVRPSGSVLLEVMIIELVLLVHGPLDGGREPARILKVDPHALRRWHAADVLPP